MMEKTLEEGHPTGPCRRFPRSRRDGRRRRPGAGGRRLREVLRHFAEGSERLRLGRQQLLRRHSSTDFDPVAWKLVKKGTCTATEVKLPDGNMRKGSLEPITG